MGRKWRDTMKWFIIAVSEKGDSLPTYEVEFSGKQALDFARDLENRYGARLARLAVDEVLNT